MIDVHVSRLLFLEIFINLLIEFVLLASRVIGIQFSHGIFVLELKYFRLVSVFSVRILCKFCAALPLPLELSISRAKPKNPGVLLLVCWICWNHKLLEEQENVDCQVSRENSFEYFLTHFDATSKVWKVPLCRPESRSRFGIPITPFFAREYELIISVRKTKIGYICDCTSVLAKCPLKGPIEQVSSRRNLLLLVHSFTVASYC